MIVSRTLQASLKNQLKINDIHRDVIMLGGARQTGKSTLVANLLHETPHIWLNLYENPPLASRIDQTQTFADLETLLFTECAFRPGDGKVLVIDECQEAKKLGSWVRFFKENWKNQSVILLGSILPQLFSDQESYPVGRVREWTLRPFHFEEFLHALGKSHLIRFACNYDFDNPPNPVTESPLRDAYLLYMQTGGMPRIVFDFVNKQQNIDISWQGLLRQFSLDVERYTKETQASLFIHILNQIAAHTSQPLKYSQILATDSAAYRQLPSFLELLDRWHLSFKACACAKHPEGRTHKASKRYLIDTGLVAYFLHRNQPLLWQHRPESMNPVYGKLQEHFVAQELVALDESVGSNLSFYQANHNAKEIDFIWRGIPIEVKSQATVNRNHLKPMATYLKEQGRETGVLIYNGPVQKLMYQDKKIWAIPPYLLRFFLVQSPF
jgi:hypothetical protein